MYPRYIKASLLRAFQASPISLLLGPRQSGKTTLMREIAKELGMEYVTFDTLSQLAAAREDPQGFIEGIKTPIIIDEVQRVPQIALPIKASVDENRIPGSFGLTGSANPLVAPKLNDSLAGRMLLLHMWPLATCEIMGSRYDLIERLFDPSASFSKGTRMGAEDLVAFFERGGYPELIQLDEDLREKCYDNLLTTIIERDVQDIKSITRPNDLAKILRFLATRSASLLNLSEISRSVAIPYTTLNHYMVLLESLFLVIRGQAWHQNRSKRLMKMPKIYFGDTGLLINQLRVNRELLLRDRHLLRSILENFVFLEFKKHATWSAFSVELYHYRTRKGAEVDLILENRSGDLIAIEVKASETLNADDLKGIKAFQEDRGEKLFRGIIFYLGKEVVTFGKNLLGLPLSTIWH